MSLKLRVLLILLTVMHQSLGDDDNKSNDNNNENSKTEQIILNLSKPSFNFEQTTIINNDNTEEIEDQNAWNIFSDDNASSKEDQLIRNNTKNSFFITSSDDPIFDSISDNNKNNNKLTDELLEKTKDVFQEQKEITQEDNNENNSVVQKLLSRKRTVQNQDDNTNNTIIDTNADELSLLQSLEELLDVYSPARLSSVWYRTKDLHLTSQCYNDVRLYLTALKQGVIWALQMSDASGRYGGGFLWGNTYWVGSATLCQEIQSQKQHPPFKLGFYMLRTRIQLKKDITPIARSQLLGICLPSSCTGLDASRLVELSAREARLDSERSLEIYTVKAPQDTYYMTTDPTFWVLIFISSVVFILLVLGTGLDLYLEKVLARDRNYTYDNYTFVFSKSIHHSAIRGGQTVVKVDINGENNNGTLSDGLDGSGMITESNSVASDEGLKKPGLICEIFLSFSVRRNLMAICDKSVGDDTIPTVHGLRSLSMAWVILGHTCIVAFKYSDNMQYRRLVEKELLFQTINNAAFSVDTFFFISGLLVSFLYFRTTAKHDLNKITKATGFLSYVLQFIGMIAYRFGRLTSPYLFVLGVTQISMKWFHYNSIFEPPAADHINCPNYWWRNILYINTLFPVKDMCMLWSWYLADDTQFYVLGAILLIMAVKHFRAATTLMAVFLVSSWCTTAYIAYSNKHMPNVDDPLALFDKIYDKPWTRLGPYLVGMCTGWLLFKTDCKINFNKVAATIGWIMSTFGLIALLYGLYEQELHPVTAAAYSSLSHTIWAVCLAWIVIACSTGNGGYVNDFLSWTVLYPFSRVTYCAYLIHPIIIRILAMRMDSPVHLGKDLVGVIFFGQLVASYLLAFVISLAYEAPIVSLLRIVSPTKRKTK
ncbi:O-acyltransferase like protein [Lycorma delicatula]|uniref:O-acyltransferase like protein n=1 Tax=Lycorma delicatula TaxID=130591 RepID=UPI003F519C01